MSPNVAPRYFNLDIKEITGLLGDVYVLGFPPTNYSSAQ